MHSNDYFEIMKKLQEPFPPEEIEWRVDRGQKTERGNFVFVLAYVTNRAIMNRLDEVFGPFGWKNEFREWRGNSQICGISAKVGDEWVTKWDGSDDSNMDAIKGGLSGAMKRAAVQWGIGRYLYNLDQNKVPLKTSGENWTSVKVKVSGKEEYITGYWDTPKLPDWALPKGYQRPVDRPRSATNQGEVSTPPKPETRQDEPYSGLANESSMNTQTGQPAKKPITENQRKMFWVRAKQAGFETSEQKQEMWELLSAKLARWVSDTSHIEMSEFNGILKWFEERMQGAA